MRIYGTMPPALHDYSNGGVNSEVLKWIIARHLEIGETIDIAEAGKLYRRAWACKRPPFVKDKETKIVRGVRHGSKTRVFRTMPQMREDTPTFDAWLNEHVSVDQDISIPSWLEAIECGELIEVSKGENDVLTTVGADFSADPNELEDQQSSDESHNESESNDSEDADSEKSESDDEYAGESRQLEPWEILRDVGLFGNSIQITSNKYLYATQFVMEITVSILADFDMLRGGAVVNSDSAAV